MKRIVQLTLCSLLAGALEKSSMKNELNKSKIDKITVNEHNDKADDLFKLEEDQMIIEKPSVSPSSFDGKQDDKNKEEIVPVYTFDENRDLSVREEVKINGKLYEDIDPYDSDLKANLSDSEIIRELFNQTTESNEQKFTKVENQKEHFIHQKHRKKIGRGRNRQTLQMYDVVKLSDRKRPVFAVLSEPMKSDILNSTSDNLNSGGYLDQDEQIPVAVQKTMDQVINSTEEQISYIPRAHVQFIEQGGARVVPISFMDSEERIEAILNEVNGIYFPGDSQNCLADKQYQKAFTYIFQYVQKHNKEQDYFPMFLMGKSAQVFVQFVSSHKTHLHDMKNHQNKNFFLRLLQKNEDTFLLHQLQNDTSVSHAFDLGEFFSKQDSGLMMRDIESDPNLKKFIQPLATFEGTGTMVENYLNMKNKQDTDYYNDDEEFIAIAEGRELPIYMFTYNPEMTQFVHTAIEGRVEQDEVIDKCIAARHHAQFISHQIADEGRMNEHKFTKEQGPLYTYLIRNYEIASVQYPSQETEDVHNKWPLPIGLETHDVYIIRQSQIEKINGKLQSSQDRIAQN